MTWLFTQVWLWSLFSFGLGSLITWLLFVRPLQRRLDQLLAEPVEEFDFERSPVDRDAPTETMDSPLGLFDPDPEPEEPVEEPPMGDWDRRPRPWLPLDQQPTEQHGGRAPVRGGECEPRTAGQESTKRFPTPPQPEPQVQEQPEPQPRPQPEPQLQSEPQPQPEPRPEPQRSQSPWFVALEERTRPVEPVGAAGEEEARAEAPAAEPAEEPPAEEGGALPRRTPGAGPYPGKEPGKDPGGNGPQVKGHSASRQYHTPDSPVYDEIEADVWFRTAEDAEIAGFRPWNGRPVR